MSTTGPKPKPSIVRLIHGETHKERLHDERPKFAAMPELPPGVALTVAESAMWDYLMRHVYQPEIHGTGDGAAFLEVCRLWERVNLADEKVRADGFTIEGGKKLSALARLSRDTWRQLDAALASIGATPSGRYRLGGPRRGGDGNDWSSLD